MGQTWVKSVDLNSDGQLDVVVALWGFEAGAGVHISGQATQPPTGTGDSAGAFASFSDFKEVPASDWNGQALIPVTANVAATSEPFDLAQPLTVVATAATVWATFLASTEGTTAPEHNWEKQDVIDRQPSVS
jgi:hypothetical protein